MAHLQPGPVVVDTSRSPFARLKPVPLTAARLSDEFWAPRLRINREVTLPSQYRLMEETGRLDNFRRAAGKKDGPFKGYMYNDSDVYKWLEACAWTMAAEEDAEVARMADTVIELIAAAQEPDGYLDTYFTFERAAERWTNLADKHELYCAGHLMQAAVAHHRATGSRRLLEVATRLADHVVARFGPGGPQTGTSGHPEIEMALAELARETGRAEYRRQAQIFVDNRGRGLIGGREYHLDHVPFRYMERLGGHAVRALYLSAGATDLFSDSGEPALRQAIVRLWTELMRAQVYVSGGVGARHDGESIGGEYELPNERAYAETCAAIASVMWNWRLLALEGEARNADALETALYNGVLPGVSLDGRGYFYENPLASDGSHWRRPWFPCACCPPNAARLLASLPGYHYSVSDEGVWVHLYAEGTASPVLPDGQRMDLAQHTRYPWDGDVSIEVRSEGRFTLYVRVPAWCESGAGLEVNGRAHEADPRPGSYVAVDRAWQAGDRVDLHLPMPVRRVESHPYLFENAGRVALMRGPLLYCLEGADHPGLDPRDVVLPAGSELEDVFCPDVLGGVVVLRGAADVLPPDAGWEDRLYRTAGTCHLSTGQAAANLTAIPYYAWANREPGPMQVWLRAGA